MLINLPYNVKEAREDIGRNSRRRISYHLAGGVLKFEKALESDGKYRFYSEENEKTTKSVSGPRNTTQIMLIFPSFVYI